MVVLEARDRVGGRVHTRVVDGVPVDCGGTWFGPGQDAAYGLAAEMGATTCPTYTSGEGVFVRGGKPARYKGEIPSNAGLAALASMGIAVKRLDRMARQVPVEAPWEAPKAEEWDRTTVAAWIARNVPRGRGRRMVEAALTDVITSGTHEASLLFLLFLVNTHGGLEKLLSIDGGVQQDRVVGGTQSIANAVAAELGDSLRLDSPVERIGWRDGEVEVVANGSSVVAERAIVAIPATLISSIRFEPGLPATRALLNQRLPVGPLTKLSLVYDEAWWRADGLSGISVDLDSHFPVTLDGCASDDSPGVLFGISAGDDARGLAALPEDQRRGLVLRELGRRFGSKAANVAHYIETDWAAERYTRSGSAVTLAPGVLTGYGRALRDPVGPIHWAGTETATVNYGCIDGAICSGERAATEVLAGTGAGSARPEPVPR